MDTWDRRFMELADTFASWSKDPSTKVGAVIVDHDRRILGTGYNGFPRYVKDLPERYADKALKYKFVVHSEANAILNAIAPIRGMTLYTTKFPCSECTKLIIQAGISKVYTRAPSTTEPWATDAEFSKIMLSEACVYVHTF